MSEVKVNKISPRTNCGTVTLGDSGDTFTIPAGATITNNGTAAGFGSTGEVSWDTTKKTTGFTSTSGVGYFADTTSSAFTITLPASPSAGNVVAISDYTGTFATNNLTVGRNSSNINGNAADIVLAKNNTTVQLIYVDATEGWRIVFTGSQTGDGLFENFLCATGGTITTSGNCRIHTFTGPGTFTVNSTAETAANNEVSYMVIAGGGAGGKGHGGGGGAGGFRETKSPVTPYTASPLDGQPSAPNRITVTATDFPITVGAGGAGSPASGCGTPFTNNSGSNSVFSTITSAGGGKAANWTNAGATGGSGGGGGGPTAPTTSGYAGNTPPTTPPQGNPGGNGTNPGGGGGGGGATASGGNSTSPGPNANGGAGGAGATTSINGSPTAFAGGGGGGNYFSPGVGGAGGTGGGGAGATVPADNAVAGTANTGGGGGGGGANYIKGAAGGSGIVIIRYKFQ